MGISDLQKRIITRSRAAARQQIANDMIGSIGAPRSMSRSIEAAIGDPAAVSMPMLRLTAVSPGLKPFSAAIAQHAPNMSLDVAEGAAHQAADAGRCGDERPFLLLQDRG